MSDTDKKVEPVFTGLDLLKLLFEKKEHCENCTGDGHCSCSEKDE